MLYDTRSKLLCIRNHILRRLLRNHLELQTGVIEISYRFCNKWERLSCRVLWIEAWGAGVIMRLLIVDANDHVALMPFQARQDFALYIVQKAVSGILRQSPVY